MARIEGRWRKVVVGLSIAGVALVLRADGCGGKRTPTEPDEIFQVSMVNDDDEAVHLLAPGENFPTGRVEPGEARPVTVEILGLGVFFRAGRNGEILAQIFCGPNSPDNLTGVVVWSGQGPGQGLGCGGGLQPL